MESLCEVMNSKRKQIVKEENPDFNKMMMLRMIIEKTPRMISKLAKGYATINIRKETL